MKTKLIQFALWLGIIAPREEELTDQQKLDQLMFYMASDEAWTDYVYTRWTLTHADDQAARDRLAANVLQAVRSK
jgi:hypothetical protein